MSRHGRVGRALAANAVEELLRYLTIAQDVVMRVAIEDLTIGGQLDIDRNPRGHLAFGYGVHQCIGQSSRVELQIALTTLLRGLPGLRPAVPMEQVNFRHDMTVYGVHELPVAW